MKRALQITAITVLLLAAGAGVNAGAALARKGNVLVFAQVNFHHDLDNAAADLRSLGYTVTVATKMPAKLSAYSSVWSLRLYGVPTSEEEEALENYVKNGGRLYLTGERRGFDENNESSQRIARAVLKNQGIVVGQQGDVGGDPAFNPAAEDEIATHPNALTSFPADLPGGIAGIGSVGQKVADKNVLASNGTTAVGAVFDQNDMADHKGRLVIYMDVNWLETPESKEEEEDPAYDQTTRLKVIENLEAFLEGSSAAAHDADENVLVVGSREKTQDGLRTAAVLRSLHYKVTLTLRPALTLARRRPGTDGLTSEGWHLPKLKKYSSVWSLVGGALPEEDRTELEQYVYDGGRAYLGGNPVDAVSHVDSDADVIHFLLMDEQLKITDDAANEGPMQFVASAPDGITRTPSSLSEMPTVEPAELSGIDPRNVMARVGDAVTAAAFDEADMNSGRGRLVVYPDEWTKTNPDPTLRGAFVQNVQDFLEATPARLAPRSAEYVGLGDSYASGQGSAEYDPATSAEGGCYRALNGYVARIAADDHMSLAFPACAGAQIGEVWASGKRESQLAAVGSDTRAITLSVGGDDMGFAGVLKTCLLPKVHFRVLGVVTEGCSKALQGPVETAKSWLRFGREPGVYKRPGGDKSTNMNYQPSLQQLYESILYQAPGAELVVVAYPHLMESAIPASEAYTCDVVAPTPVSVPLSIRASDLPWINEQTDDVDQIIADAVNATREATGRQIRLADPRNAYYTHGLCDTSTSYINELVFENPVSGWKLEISKAFHRQPEALHPTKEGQEALRSLIEETADEF
jgi:hypothetical protein